MVDFKKLLAERNKKAAATPATTNTLANKFKKPLNTTADNNGGLRDKFQKRAQNVLQKTYEKREEQSKSSGMGKSIFNQELLEQFGIKEFQTSFGDHFVEMMPISYDPSEPYVVDGCVHYRVGVNGDAYLCMHRMKGKACYRCEQQNTFYRQNPHATQSQPMKDYAKSLFPTDRAFYLMWERTKELVEGAAPDFTFQIWSSPKKAVHSEIQSKVTNKLTRTVLDISDVSVGGDGRTVTFTIVKKGDWPDYNAFDLIPREKPIPEEVLEKLDVIISAAQEAGFNNAIEMFLHFPEYDEVKESMETEGDINDIIQRLSGGNNATPAAQQQDNSNATGGRPPLRQGFSKATTQQAAPEPEPQDDSELITQLMSLQSELEAMNIIVFKKWCKENGYEEASYIAKTEAIPAIIDDLYAKECSKNTY